MPAPRHYRAPSEDGGTLIEPSETQVPELLQQNRRSLSLVDWQIGDKHFHELRNQAREELITAAVEYTATYRQIPAVSADSLRPILLAGHQPQLFHPGVWFKNFLLSRLAADHGGAAINLIVDHDTFKQPAIAVPTGSLIEPRLENVPFDAPLEERPYEERTVVDQRTAEDFPDRVWNALDSLPYGPSEIVLDSLWPHVRSELARHGNWGRATAAGRHLVEGGWGLQTLELPTSAVWDSVCFRWFLAWIFADMPRFFEAYNRALAGYRSANGLKSLQHPVPNLLRDGDWYEAPFWLWTSQQPIRERMFVCRRDKIIAWRAGTARGTLPAQDGGHSLSAIVEGLSNLRERGVKVRPRAILTTLYSRLFLSDLFIHGIGGAKYDEVTDAIMVDHFGVQPPAFVTATATLRLPVPRPAARESDIGGINRQLRELEWHGEQSAATAGSAIASQKRALLDSMPPRGSRRQWHEQISAVNRALAASLAAKREELETQLSETITDLRRGRLLGSREFSFCLFPPETLRAAFNA